MMKFVLTLVFLFCCCNGYKLNTKLNREIIVRLSKLNDLCSKQRQNITLPEPMQVPGKHMLSNARSCVSVFVKELGNLLQNVTVPNNSQHILEELQADLNILAPHRQTDARCQMEQAEESFNAFQPYIGFVKELKGHKIRRRWSSV